MTARRSTWAPVIAGAAALLAASCGASSAQLTTRPPQEFQAACGHPGSVVELTAVPVVVPHAACDLAGVVIRYQGVGVTVPPDGSAAVHADGLASKQLTVTVDPGTKDVSIHG